jgi:hypothetical protein
MPKHPFDAEFLCDIEADLGEPELIGAVPEGVRTTFYIKGGKIEGPEIRGKIRPVGADWFLLRPDGVGQLDVRATVETDDGELIYVSYNGLLDLTVAMAQGSADAEQPAPEPRIFTNPIFRTASEKYSWLNRTFAVAVGAPGENKVSYSVYRLK